MKQVLVLVFALFLGVLLITPCFAEIPTGALGSGSDLIGSKTPTLSWALNQGSTPYGYQCNENGACLYVPTPTIGISSTSDASVISHIIYRDFTKNAQGQVSPIGETTDITSSDTKVVSWVVFKNGKKGDSLTWTWIKPNGEAYRSWTYTNSYDGSKSGYTYIDLTNEVKQYPGKWTVRFSINGKNTSERTFTLNLNSNAGYAMLVNPGSQHRVNDKFLIWGSTNLPVDSIVDISIFPSSIAATECNSVKGWVKVIGGSGGLNTWSFPIDTANFMATDYSVDISFKGTLLLKSKLFTLVPSNEGTAQSSNPTTTTNSQIPFVAAHIDPHVISPGQSTKITGTATGNPSPGIAIWILGPNTVKYSIIKPKSDNSFSYSLPGTQTKKFPYGMYYIVVQHPMYNNKLDIYPNKKLDAIMSLFPKKDTLLAKLSMNSNDAGWVTTKAIGAAIEENGVDDSWIKMQLLVDTPTCLSDETTCVVT